jgi:hypothetical protein
MKSIRETKIEQRPRPGAFMSTLRRASLVAALALFTALPSHANSGYSGASVGSNGTVYGWGVTDATTYSMYHVAYVSTALYSPKGRYNGYGMHSAQNSVREDVSLAFDPTDLGTYLVQSTNEAYCYSCSCWLFNFPSACQATVPWVTLALRNGNTDTVSSDNHALNAYNQFNGTTALGTYQASTDHFWQTGVEIVGTVCPSSYTGLITLRRQILNRYEYNNSTTANPIWPPCPSGPSCDDTDSAAFRDDDPQSDGSNGRVYDLDTPGIGPLSTDNTYDRYRVNFREYAMAEGVSVQVSANFNWWSRLSVQRSSGNTTLKTDVTGDNVSGTGTTKLSWNLQ